MISVAPLCVPHVVVLGGLCHAEIFKYLTYNVKTSCGTSYPCFSPYVDILAWFTVCVTMLPHKWLEWITCQVARIWKEVLQLPHFAGVPFPSFAPLYLVLLFHVLYLFFFCSFYTLSSFSTFCTFSSFLLHLFLIFLCSLLSCTSSSFCTFLSCTSSSFWSCTFSSF